MSKKILVVGNVDQRVIDRLIEMGHEVTTETTDDHFKRLPSGLSFDQVWIDEVSFDVQSNFLRSPSSDLYWMGQSGF